MGALLGGAALGYVPTIVFGALLVYLGLSFLWEWVVEMCIRDSCWIMGWSVRKPRRALLGKARAANKKPTSGMSQSSPARMPILSLIHI